MKASELARLTGVDEQTARARTDPVTAVLARDAVKMVSAVDAGLVKSVAEAMGGLDAAKLINLTGMREAARAYESAAFSNATRLASEHLAEGLNALNAANTARMSEAIKDLQVMPLVVPRQMTKTLAAIGLPPALRCQLAEALSDLPSATAVNVSPGAAAALEQAVALAFDSDAVTEIVEKSIAEIDDMSAVKRRELSADAAEAIVRVCVVIALLTRNSQVALVSASLAVAAIFVVIYWRATGKLDA